MRRAHEKKSQGNTHAEYLSGLTKVKDGLYMGDEKIANVLMTAIKEPGLHYEQ